MAESFAEQSFPADIVTYSERRAYLRGRVDGARSVGTALVGVHATSQKALAHQPTLCSCRDEWNCHAMGETACDGSICREHVTPIAVRRCDK